jgi:hypothetical protein
MLSSRTDFQGLKPHETSSGLGGTAKALIQINFLTGFGLKPCST